jgi:Rps23 Pro-64 3,4-dihydroxylase Tpa1-like proline 4-hydroxylase
MERNQLADLITNRLRADLGVLKAQYAASQASIGYFYIDDVLPESIAHRIYAAFPKTGKMIIKRSLREHKFIAAQMDQYDPVLEEAIYAFQDDRVVALIRDICGLRSVYPDENLYAGGISAMGQGHFLNPHLDNSHDKNRERWRVLNLLYYVTPNWPEDIGGNLEVWPEGPAAFPVKIHSRFNRLAVMATHQKSWHSVSPVVTDKIRCCVSNYYFSDEPLNADDSFHVTTFRGRPEQFVRNKALQLDAMARMMLRRAFKRGITKPRHLYKK